MKRTETLWKVKVWITSMKTRVVARETVFYTEEEAELEFLNDIGLDGSYKPSVELVRIQTSIIKERSPNEI